MGTSKGYIAPTKPEWTQTKRAISSMLKDPSSSNIAKTVDRYANALQVDNFSSSSFPSTIGNFIGLVNSVRANGVDGALREHGFENLIGKSNDEILNSLLNHYSNGNGTIDDNLIIDCLSNIMDIFTIDSLEDFNQITNEQLLIELVINYTQLKFEQMFEEKIRADRSPTEGSRIMSDVKNYLRDHLQDNLTISDLSNIDFMNIQGQNFIIETCRSAYALLRTYDEE